MIAQITASCYILSKILPPDLNHWTVSHFGLKLLHTTTRRSCRLFEMSEWFLLSLNPHTKIFFLALQCVANIGKEMNTWQGETLHCKHHLHFPILWLSISTTMEHGRTESAVYSLLPGQAENQYPLFVPTQYESHVAQAWFHTWWLCGTWDIKKRPVFNPKHCLVLLHDSTYNILSTEYRELPMSCSQLWWVQTVIVLV